MRRGAPLAQQSSKRAGKAAERRAVVDEVHRREYGRCQAERLVPDVECAGPMDVHEVVQRSLSSTSWLDPDQCLLLCRAHHRWIDDNIALAHDLGLLRHSWDADPPPTSG